MRKPLLNRLGLLGLVSLLSYTAAVIFSPMKYDGYNWMSQAVSDLSAVNAPSRELWNQLSALYVPCGIVSVMAVCVYIHGKLNKALRTGIYLFAIMQWISAIGYAMFPLTQAGTPSGFQNMMHLLVTAAVVLLSIASLAMVAMGGFRNQCCRSLGFWALAALMLMIIGGAGSGLVPDEYFGIPERFSVFSAVGFNAVLGVCLYKEFS